MSKVLVDGIPAVRLSEICRAEQEGRLVILPCKVGGTVWVITSCKFVRTWCDDDYFTGTGAIECPFESSCGFEDCNESNVRIFETWLNDFWYGEENDSHPEVFCEGLGKGFMLSDFGKTIFLTSEAAEEALEKRKTAPKAATFESGSRK